MPALLSSGQESRHYELRERASHEAKEHSLATLQRSRLALSASSSRYSFAQRLWEQYSYRLRHDLAADSDTDAHHRSTDAHPYYRSTNPDAGPGLYTGGADYQQ